MRQILVYGDSLSWGIIPGTRERLPFPERWPGVMESQLTAKGLAVRVFENCINGRRTVWDDPFKAGRNGRVGLAQAMEMNSPLDLVILMLGINDFQYCHPFNNAWASAQGIAALVEEIRKAPVEPGMPVPPILVVCPPEAGEPKGWIAEKFAGAQLRCKGLADAFREVSERLGCSFFDAGSVVSTSPVDGIHLERESHRVLGEAMARLLPTIPGLLAG